MKNNELIDALSDLFAERDEILESIRELIDDSQYDGLNEKLSMINEQIIKRIGLFNQSEQQERRAAHFEFANATWNRFIDSHHLAMNVLFATNDIDSMYKAIRELIDYLAQSREYASNHCFSFHEGKKS